MQLQQLDFFDVTLEKKIHRLERWIKRLEKEMWFLKEVYNMNEARSKNKIVAMRTPQQMDMFG